MNLQSILLVNVAPFDRLELVFRNDNVVVLSGINGTGKTTILSFIADAFYELAKKAFRNEFEDKTGKYYRISSNIFSIDHNKPSIVYMRFENAGSFIDYIDIRGLCAAEEYESHVNIANRIPFSDLENQLKNDGVYKYWTISSKTDIERIFHNNILAYFPSYRYEIPFFLNDPYKTQLRFKTTMDYTGYLPNPIEVTSDLPQIANWILDVVLDTQLYPDNTSEIFLQLNEIISIILTSKVPEKVILGVGPRASGASRVSIKMRDSNQILYPSIFGMSSGELALFSLFCELLKQSDIIRKRIHEVSGVVVIDEIDKHLHIQLQKEILPRLLALFPNIRFITSSHSPFLGIGLEDKEEISFNIIDLERGGLSCPPQNNDLFKEVYDIMMGQQEELFSRYNDLLISISDATRPLLITEGKSDWKHIKAAISHLGITNFDIDIFEYEDALGDESLLQILRNNAMFFSPRLIIGMFDRDNFQALNLEGLSTNRYVHLGENVFAFAIPLVNENLYGTEISIEHYYKRENLLKESPAGRRLFLGDEFYDSGISKDNRYHARCKGIHKKVLQNGVVDDKVYDILTDPQEIVSVAMSKNEYAECVLYQKDFAEEFDFTSFNEIIKVIREICEQRRTLSETK